MGFALKGASREDLAALRRLLTSNGLTDRHFVTAWEYGKPREIGVGIDMVQLALDSSSITAAASGLALWLSTRTTTVEVRVETGGTVISLKSGDLNETPDAITKLTEGLQQAMRS